MGVWTEAGVLTLTNTGSSATNAVGSMPDKPRAVFFFLVQATALDTFTAHSRYSIGYAARSSAEAVTQVAMASANVDALATSDSGQRGRADCCIIGGTTPGSTYTEDGRATIAFDANGFTLTNATAFTSAWRVGYFAVGGSDLTDAKAGEFLNQNATGNQDVTDPGFQPNVVFISDIGFSSSVPASSAGISQCWGYATSADVGNCISWRDNNNLGTWSVANTQRTDKIIYATGTGSTIFRDASLTSMLSTGFSLNHVVANDNRLFYLAIKGGVWDAGSLTSSTSSNGAGDFASSVPTPRGALVASRNLAAASTVNTTDIKLSIGALDEDGDEWCGWAGTDNADEDSAVRISATKGIIHAIAGNTDVLDGEADLTFVGQTLRSTWTDADNSAKEVLCLVVGESAPVDLPAKKPVVSLQSVHSWSY